MKQNNEERKVSVIGLGLMGTALAQVLIKNGFDVTVWNRTRKKAVRLADEGAKIAHSVADAVKASSFTVVCVYDYKAFNEIFDTAEVNSELNGKTIINLTTGSPKEARETEKSAHQNGAAYIDGAILATPKQMGDAETIILFSGEKNAYQKSELILKTFGGNLKYLDENIGAASAMDLGVLSYTYGAALGFFHGARIGEVEGFQTSTLGEIILDFSKTIGGFIKYEADVIEKDNFTASESQMNISIEAVERILKTAQESGINTEFPTFASSIFRQAKNSGFENEELAALIKVFRGHSSTKEATK